MRYSSFYCYVREVSLVKTHNTVFTRIKMDLHGCHLYNVQKEYFEHLNPGAFVKVDYHDDKYAGISVIVDGVVTVFAPAVFDEEN